MALIAPQCLYAFLSGPDPEPIACAAVFCCLPIPVTHATATLVTDAFQTCPIAYLCMHPAVLSLYVVSAFVVSSSSIIISLIPIDIALRNLSFYPTHLTRSPTLGCSSNSSILHSLTDTSIRDCLHPTLGLVSLLLSSYWC